MFECIVVPLDGSASSRAALALATAMAREGSREIVGCHAVDTRSMIAAAGAEAIAYDPTLTVEVLTSQGQAILAEARETARSAAVTLATELVFDDPVAAVLGVARAHHADAIVMGTHGRRGLAHLLLGSTAEGVLRHADIPVITIRSERDDVPVWPFKRALVALDDSDPSDAATELALRLGGSEAVRLAFCTVVETADLLGKAATYGYDPRPILADFHRDARDLLDGPLGQAQARGLAADSVVVEGKPAEAIQTAATSFGADVIVIGSHGRRGLRRFFVGSVAEDVVRSSSLPVVVVRTAKPAATHLSQPARNHAPPASVLH